MLYFVVIFGKKGIRLLFVSYNAVPRLCRGAPLHVTRMLFLFLAALVVDDGERRFVDEGDALFLGDIHHLLQGGF